MTDLVARHLAWLKRGDIHNRPRAKRTVEDRGIILRFIDRELPDGLAQASADEIVAFLEPYAPDDGWYGWTLTTYDTALRVFYGWAVEVEGALGFNPMAHIGRPGPGRREPHPCTDEQLALALAAPRWPWRRGVILAAYGGLRISELCSVTTEDVIGDRLSVRGKGGKTRLVPIPPVMADELRDTADGHLLLGARGLPINGRVLSTMQRPVWAKLGLPDTFSFHSLRHWYVTRLIESGATMPEAAALAGHASLVTTQGYAAVVDRRLSAAVARLPRVVEPGGSRLDAPRAA